MPRGAGFVEFLHGSNENHFSAPPLTGIPVWDGQEDTVGLCVACRCVLPACLVCLCWAGLPSEYIYCFDVIFDVR